MDLASLHAFVEVARERSFSRAAANLFLTQPAVSKRIAGLEEELATRLFDRASRQILLTEAGRHLLPRAERIIHELTDIRRELSNLSGEVAGRLAMATSHHIGLHRMPVVLRRYTERYPGVDLDIRFMESERACQAVEQGELELAVVTLPLEPADSLRAEAVWSDPLRAVVGLDHPLAREGLTDLDHLLSYPAVLPTLRTYTRTLLEQRVARLHRQVVCTLSTDYLETLKMMASIGLGWSLLPETMLDDHLKPLELAELDLTRLLGVVTHRRRTLSNAASAMRTLLLEADDSVKRH
jgi:DNA-binding transcriptional LysR family regulator